MIKTVALERIVNVVNRVVYAEKHEELKLIKHHDDEFSVYYNARLEQTFITRKTKVAEIEERDIIFFVEKQIKKEKQSNRKKDVGNDNQGSLF